MGIFSNVCPQEKAVNDQIQMTHNQINELYMDIGRHVKLNLKDKIDDQYIQNACRNIDDCLARLQQLNTDLNAIRGIKLCTNCNAQIPMGVTFCPSCGTKQPDMPMNNMAMGGMNQMGGYGVPMGAPMGGPVMGGAPMGGAPMGGYPQPQNAPFNPVSAGNSPANPNKNMMNGGNGGFQPPVQQAAVPPVPPAPQAPAPADPAGAQQADPLAGIPPVPPIPDNKPESKPLDENVVTNQPQQPKAVEEEKEEKTESPVIQPEKTEAPTGEFIFCSQCGHREKAGVAFCSQCGSKL